MAFQQSPQICPVCNEGNNFKFIQDHQNKDGKFSLYECNFCHVQFWQPFKSANSQWYDRRLHSQHFYLSEDTKEGKSVKPWHKEFFKWYKNFPNNIRILDLGCGGGEFLNEFSKRGYKIQGRGVDYSHEENKRAFKNILINVSSFDEFFKENKNNVFPFDFIVFFEVLEHLDNPLKFIKNVKEMLKPEGKIVLSVPSRERMFANMNNWDFPPNHLTRWNKESISNLFKKINFKISKVKYVGSFTFFLQLINAKSSLNLIRKTKNSILKGKPNSLILYFIYKTIRYLAIFKSIFFSSFFAGLLWIIGKITRQRNGSILVELVPINQNN